MDELLISSYNQLKPKVERYMARMVSEEDAEDLAQEVFLRACRSIGGFKGESNISAWMSSCWPWRAGKRLRKNPAA